MGLFCYNMYMFIHISFASLVHMISIYIWCTAPILISFYYFIQRYLSSSNITKSYSNKDKISFALFIQRKPRSFDQKQNLFLSGTTPGVLQRFRNCSPSSRNDIHMQARSYLEFMLIKFAEFVPLRRNKMAGPEINR